MPDCGTSATSSGAQPLLSKFCPDCGATVFGRTMHKQYCDECRRLRRLDNYKRAAEKQRRKNGIPKVKGETFACGECGNNFVATSKSRAKWCCDCAQVVSLRRANERSRLRSSDPDLRERFNEWYRDRAKADPLVALSRMMRSLMHRELGKKDTTSRGSWYQVVGYTAQELRDHLERQFLPGMTWNNRGMNGWHVDHIRPISSFNYDGPDHPEFKECWALTNLRPLWGTDNVRKSAKQIYLI